MQNKNSPGCSMQDHRQKFPALKNKHYLNFGGQGVMPESAIEAIRQAYEYVQEHGPFSRSMLGWMQNQMLSARQILAEEFGGEPGSYALTQNTTEGCNIVLWGLDWHEGDILATTDSEHTGVMAAVLQVCKRMKLKLETCRISSLTDDDQILAEVEKLLQRRPRLFLISHVLWNTGRLLPLEKIVKLCRERGVRVLVDGAQSAGVLPLNLADLNADYYAFTGHKWLGGPEGTGALYVNPDSLETIEPTYAGWRGAVFDTTGNPTGWAANASRFEVATGPFPLLSGFTRAIQEHRLLGTAVERYARILQNTQRLKDRLSALPGLKLLDERGKSSLVSFTIENASHSDLVGILEEKGIIVRTIPNPGCIRASVHYFSLEEMDLLAHELATIHGRL
jgi:L-cysteine/cystine lyase